MRMHDAAITTPLVGVLDIVATATAITAPHASNATSPPMIASMIRARMCLLVEGFVAAGPTSKVSHQPAPYLPYWRGDVLRYPKVLARSVQRGHYALATMLPDGRAFDA